MMRSGAADRLVLDTSAYSRFRAGHAQILDLVSASAVILLPTVVLGELEAGFRRGTRADENRRSLAEFLAEPFVSVLDVTHSVARRYGETFALLRESGAPIPTNDLWIAAATFDCGGQLATFDGDFARVPSLPLTLLT